MELEDDLLGTIDSKVLETFKRSHGFTSRQSAARKVKKPTKRSTRRSTKKSRETDGSAGDLVGTTGSPKKRKQPNRTTRFSGYYDTDGEDAEEPSGTGHSASECYGDSEYQPNSNTSSGSS